MKTITEVLQKLFTENTGKHFLDSGGTDGRQWQKNQTRDFESEPEVTIEYWDGKFSYITVNTYHYFKQVLEVDEVCESVNEVLRENNHHWVGNVDFEDVYEGVLRSEQLDEWCIDVHGSSLVEYVGGQWNTYNGEYNTDHVFLGQFVKIDNEPYVLLQLHLGADVRVGYSDVQLFKVEGFLTGCPDVSIYSEKRNASIDFRGGDIELYDHETHDSEHMDRDDLEEHVKDDNEWEASLMICEDPMVY